MADHTPLMPHGAIEEVFPDIFLVTGTSKPNFEGGAWQFSRNMTILRSGEDLTVVNTVRLNDEGLAALDALGKVRNVVRLGAFHGMDDRFYLDRYQAKQWALPGMDHEGGQQTDTELQPGGPMPVEGCSIFVWETSQMPEALLVLERDGGMIVSCDSLQNWVEADAFFSEDSAKKMTELGFIKPANIGPGWLRFAKPEKSDFVRVLALPFKHLLPAHGRVLKEQAHEMLSATFKAAYDIA